MILSFSTPEASARRMATIGTFDGVHLGHRYLISELVERSRNEGLRPTVITFDGHPRIEGAGLLQNPADKVEDLLGCGVADVILLTSEVKSLTAIEFMRRLRSDFGVEVLMMGYNNHFGHDRPEGFDAYRHIGREVGLRVIAAPEYIDSHGRKVNSSTIRRLIAERLPEEAAALLGRPYRLKGVVTHGRALGRQLGFPTANVEPQSAAQIVPPRGVYAARVTLPDGTQHPAMANIGHRPSVNTPAGSPDTIEVHILDFAGDLYGSEIAVDILRYMRREERFPSLEALAAQLESDAQAVRKLLG